MGEGRVACQAQAARVYIVARPWEGEGTVWQV